MNKSQLVDKIDELYAIINKLEAQLNECKDDCKEAIEIIEYKLGEGDLKDIIDAPDESDKSK
jgi:regulator of replication initiation timing